MKKRIAIVLTFILILALHASYIVYGQRNESQIDNSNNETSLEVQGELTLESKEVYIDDVPKIEESELTELIDNKIDTYKVLVGELEEKRLQLEKLDRIKDYVSFDMSSDLSQVLAIEKGTPLDMEAAAIVVDYSKKLDIKPSLILGLIKLESNFKQYEVGADDDRGYMQIIPSTEKWLAQKYGKKLGLKYNPDNIFNPEYNIGLGAIYLKILKDAYGENYDRILSEYNRGPYNLKQYYAKNNTYSTSYSRGVLSREKKFTYLN